jgi:hypothetical protein
MSREVLSANLYPASSTPEGGLSEPQIMVNMRDAYDGPIDPGIQMGAPGGLVAPHLMNFTRTALTRADVGESVWDAFVAAVAAAVLNKSI